MRFYRGTILLIALLLLPASIAAGQSPESRVEQTWARADRPVVEDRADREPVWGAEPISDALTEPYVDAPTGQRMVQYYDKSRMEVTDPEQQPGTTWDVTNGLLVSEMVTGRIQIGDATFQSFQPADIPVTGDGSDGVPAYAALADLLDAPPHEGGTVITKRVSASGEVTSDPKLESEQITAEYLVPETDHRIAAPFWEYMNRSGTIWTGDNYRSGSVFRNPFFGTGFPVTEAYWTDAGPLLQCFERRCLSYDPEGPSDQRVESNAIGAHYYAWRYETLQFGSPTVFPDSLLDLPEATFATGAGDDPTMRLEVVTNDDSRACGLMHRRSMPEDQGMLFVFSDSQTGGFWNRNTFIPLTLAWIDADGVIVELTGMEAVEPGPDQSTTSYQPDEPYRYVIEANQGWFSEHGIETRDRIDLGSVLDAGQTAPGTICDVLGT